MNYLWKKRIIFVFIFVFFLVITPILSGAGSVSDIPEKSKISKQSYSDGKIFGYVHYGPISGGDPAESVKVFCTRYDPREAIETLTDSDGYYEFINLSYKKYFPTGYYVWTQKEGYWAGFAKTVSLTEENHEIRQDFIFRKTKIFFYYGTNCILIKMFRSKSI
jgi:hypothetical protein